MEPSLEMKQRFPTLVFCSEVLMAVGWMEGVGAVGGTLWALRRMLSPGHAIDATDLSGFGGAFGAAVAALFTLAASQVLVVLLHIEDHTRRAAGRSAGDGASASAAARS